MGIKYFRSGLDLVDQTLRAKQQRDWIAYLQKSVAESPITTEETTDHQTDHPPLIPGAYASFPLPTTSHSTESSYSFGSNQATCTTSRSSLLHRHSNSSLGSHTGPDPEWRFWKWLPPKARPINSAEDYGRMVASFKDYLHASEFHVYTMNELKQFTILELSPIIDYVAEPDHSESSTSASAIRSYYIFKDGIWPLWEDEYNIAGGCWTFRLTGRTEEPQEMWKLLIHILSDPHMKPYLDTEICGAGLTIRTTPRGWMYKISIWNRDSDDTIVKMMIGYVIKCLVVFPGRLYYYSHITNIHMQQHQAATLASGGGASGNKRKKRNSNTPGGSSSSTKKKNNTPGGSSSSKKVTFALSGFNNRLESGRLSFSN